MTDDKSKYFVCGLPYQLSISEGLLSREQVEDEMGEETFNELTWSMEMECQWVGDEAGSFFEYDTLNRNRRLQRPWLPDHTCSSITETSVRVPRKEPGEVRILSADIALMASKKHNNDATAIMLNSVLPSRGNRYTSNIRYTEVWEGVHTDEQALRIRRLFEEFECDYIVIDAKGVGAGILDALLRDIYDRESDVLYPAISVCNDQAWADRSITGAKKVIWAISATAKFNSDCALLLREGFRSGKIKLLAKETEAEEELLKAKWYKSLNPQERQQVMLPYINTTLLIDEVVKLDHDESSGLVRISEKPGMRKDRYSSLSYNYWVASQLEAKMRKRAANNTEFAFNFRAPKIK